MVENIALSDNKQKAFNRSVKKTKSKIKKGHIKIASKVPRRSFRKTPIKKTGFLYLSNIPHGFYEKQLLGYFQQFGNVIKVRVARSKKTGNSKGHAFIQFEQEDVAKIAAETMNNYLMGNRLLKAKLLPHDEKTKNLFKKPNFSKEHYPTKVRQQRFKKEFNAPVTEKQVTSKVKNSLKHIDDILKKLKAAGIDYDFKPVNVPTIPGIEIEKQEVDVDDSSSEDIVFTSPEEMDKRLKGKAENNVESTPKKVKKAKIEKKNIKEDKETKSITKKKVKKEVAKNKTKSIKKNKVDSINGNITPIKVKKTKSKKKEDFKVENNADIKVKKNKIKKNKDSIPEKSIKKKSIKKKKEIPKKDLGVVKKSKRSSTLSEKKANLMVELIKTSNQVKKVNKIEKKKNKTK